MFFKGYTCVLDCETGGFNPEQNLLTQIGFIILDQDLNEVERFKSYIEPYDQSLYISKEASAITGITLDKLRKEGRPLKEVLLEIEDIFKKYKRGWTKISVVGHNIGFDIDFLEYVWTFVEGQKNRKSMLWEYIDKQTEDTMRYAHRKWGDTDKLTNFKLGTILEYLGFEATAAHDAMGDVESTVILFKYFMGCLKENQSEVKNIKKEFLFQF